MLHRKYNDLMELNGKVLNALHMYSSLMKETPVYTPFKPQDMQYNMQAYINNYAPIEPQYNSANVNPSLDQNQYDNKQPRVLQGGQQNNLQQYPSDERNMNNNPNNQKLALQ